MKKEYLNKGFTLIELLAVIIILSLFVTFAYPNIINTYRSMKMGTMLVKENDIKNNAKSYISDCLDYTVKDGLTGCYYVNGMTGNGRVYLSDMIRDHYIEEFSYENQSCEGYVYFNNDEYNTCLKCGDRYSTNDISCDYNVENALSVNLLVIGGAASPSNVMVEEGGTTIVNIIPNDSKGLENTRISCTSGISASISNSLVTLTNVNASGSCTINLNYIDTTLNGTDPILGEGMIPVILTSNNTEWTVKYASLYEKWYDYSNSQWANAVMLVSNPSKTYVVGDTIDYTDIAGYFVWIPKYKYKLFDMGNYETMDGTTITANHSIDIVFGTENTTDGDSSCAAPLSAGASGNCAVNKYMTHPAFISFNSNGFWVGKFETTGSISALTVLPGSTSLRNQTTSALFTSAYNYNRTLDSHMMKNTEWGAVAYLGNSNYGIGNIPIWKNNNSNYVTGCTGDQEIDDAVASCENAWYTTTGKKGSVTGNITGIYDMSGGVWEYMASYRADTMGSSGFTVEQISGYNAKYFDVYPNNTTENTFNKRILGDATGELGPINSSHYSSWYDDCSYYVYSWNPWFLRGGRVDNDVAAGSFAFSISTGGAYNNYGFRLVLTP